MQEISRQLLFQASETIAALMGLHFQESRFRDLERGILSASADFGFQHPSLFINWLTSNNLSKQHIEKLACHLTVGETYFFREKESFEALGEYVFPELLRKRQDEKRLRIWSAGCSTGEEPYSIAMLLSKAVFGLKGWNITILATDISPLAIKKAAKGVYTEWSFRGTPQWVKDRFFKKTGDGLYEIAPSIKKMVSFEYLNLAEDVYPSLLNNTNAMDVIFCRNVLMYFSTEKAKLVINRLKNSLVDEGWLLVSPTEALKALTRQFTAVGFKGTTFYRKDVHGHKEPEIPLFTFMAPEVSPQLSSATPMPEDLPALPRPVAEEELKKERPAATPYEEALSLFTAGRYHEASTVLEKNSEASEEAGSCALLARIYANQGRLEDARSWCEKAAASDKLNPAYHYLLATIMLEQGEAAKASASLKKSLYLDPKFVLGYFVLGSILSRNGDTESAMKNFKNALDLLSSYAPEDTIPESEGLTAGRMSELITSMAI